MGMTNDAQTTPAASMAPNQIITAAAGLMGLFTGADAILAFL